MEQLRLVGVGYFGKPEMVARVFNKISKDYRTIYKIPCLSAIENAFGPESVQITGFLLGYKNQALRISLFTKTGWGNSGQTSSIIYPIHRKNTRLH